MRGRGAWTAGEEGLVRAGASRTRTYRDRMGKVCWGWVYEGAFLPEGMKESGLKKDLEDREVEKGVRWGHGGRGSGWTLQGCERGALRRRNQAFRRTTWKIGTWRSDWEGL